jgi:hypothetical protein
MAVELNRVRDTLIVVAVFGAPSAKDGVSLLADRARSSASLPNLKFPQGREYAWKVESHTAGTDSDEWYLLFFLPVIDASG